MGKNTIKKVSVSTMGTASEIPKQEIPSEIPKQETSLHNISIEAATVVYLIKLYQKDRPHLFPNVVNMQLYYYKTIERHVLERMIVAALKKDLIEVHSNDLNFNQTYHLTIAGEFVGKMLLEYNGDKNDTHYNFIQAVRKRARSEYKQFINQ